MFKKQFAVQHALLVTQCQHESYAHNTLNPVNMTHTSKEQFAYQQGALITVLQHEPCFLVDLRSVWTIDL